MNNIQVTFSEFNIPFLSEDELLSYQKNFPNILWKLRNYTKPNILINEYSQTISVHDEENTNTDSKDSFFHKTNHRELNFKIGNLSKEISKLRIQGLEVIEKLMAERSNELGHIRFIDGISIGDEVKEIVSEMRYLEKSAIAVRYRIVELEIKIKDLEFISAELLAMEMGSIL